MNDFDYPALYRAADAASARAQTTHLATIKLYTLFTVVGAGLGAYGIQSRNSALLAAIVLIGGIFISIWMASRQYENTWYRARAVAESVKTSTWRFMMRCEPYGGESATGTVESDLRDMLKRLLNEHKDLAHELAGDFSKEEQITSFMRTTRASALAQRKTFYLNNRIDEQRKWYAKKASDNRKEGKMWFVVLVSCQATAVLFVLLRIAYPEWTYWPTEIFVVAGAGALTWIQVKRFRELTAAYGLTAHEIGIIRSELETVEGEQPFSDFVGDSENAFSREHTQWLARKTS